MERLRERYLKNIALDFEIVHKKRECSRDFNHDAKMESQPH